MERIKYFTNIIDNMQRINIYDENMIINIFQSALNNNINGYSEELEEIKNIISDKRDYNDMIDLLEHLSTQTRFKLYQIFAKNIIPNDSYYKVIVISDVDNTAIENSIVAPVKYINKELIPGFQILIKLLSNNRTTTNFISARPHIVGNKSIDSLSNKINSDLKFSFLNGNIIPLIELVSAKIFCDKIGIKRSYKHIAQYKFNKFNELLRIYPSCKFIFFGDDTQGDYIFAKYLVDSVSESIAFIRKCKFTKINPQYYSPNIIYHQSYYSLILPLIRMRLLNINAIPIILDDYRKNYIDYIYNQEQVMIDKYFLQQII